MSSNRTIFLIPFILFAIACKEKYIAPVANPTTGYLVVEGFINSGTGPTTISLSRTIKLADTTSVRKEAKATVRVEAKSGATVILPETFLGSGIYSGSPVIKAGDQYRLNITTSNGRAYISDYSDVRTTVDIDSVSWMRTSDGVRLYANAHDATSSTHYYRYSFDETWEFHSPYQSFLSVYNDNKGLADHAGYRDSTTFHMDSTIWRCWKTQGSPDILVATSEKLTSDRIAMLPIEFIENGSWKLSVLYTMNLKQYTMSREGYRYFEQLKKNTQQLGSIFDSQPSDNLGNMHCVNDPNEPVLGFVEVTQEKQKRIFISNDNVSPWVFDRGCSEESIPNISDSLQRWDFRLYYLTKGDFVSASSGSMPRVFVASYECVNCQAFGVNTRPSFWPK